jgi:hypothetical protein
MDFREEPQKGREGNLPDNPSRRDILKGSAKIAAGALSAALPFPEKAFAQSEDAKEVLDASGIIALRKAVLDSMYQYEFKKRTGESPEALTQLAEEIFNRSLKYGQSLAEFERKNPKFGTFFSANDPIDRLLRTLEESQATAPIPNDASTAEKERLLQLKSKIVEEFISQASDLYIQGDASQSREGLERFYRGFLCGYYEHLCPPSM